MYATAEYHELRRLPTVLMFSLIVWAGLMLALIAQRNQMTDKDHPGREPHSQKPHGHVSPVDHTEITDT
jgi:hypothetical protein